MKYTFCLKVIPAILMTSLAIQSATAAIALDRTRAVFDGGDKSISLNISNQNKTLPYLAQAWIEDPAGNKITQPLVAVPPVQRVEPTMKGQVKLQMMGDISELPQDRESLFYFNLREIPPKSTKANTLQIALQTRIKLFYRPDALKINRSGEDRAWMEKLTLTREGDKFRVNNPTPYYVTLAGGYRQLGGEPVAEFEPFMVEPKSNVVMAVSASALGATPVLSYINDYGGRPKLLFRCAGKVCHVTSSRAG